MSNFIWIKEKTCTGILLQGFFHMKSLNITQACFSSWRQLDLRGLTGFGYKDIHIITLH